MGITNRGKKLILEWAFKRVSQPANLYVALCTSTSTPSPDTDTLGQLAEITAGNGYSSGGFQLTPNNTDFDTSGEDDASDYGFIQIKDVSWTASGGSLPASGNGARYAVLTDNNATVGNRQVVAFWDLSSDRQVSAGQTITLQDLEQRITEN
jgi:hypothetical protein